MGTYKKVRDQHWPYFLVRFRIFEAYRIWPCTRVCRIRSWTIWDPGLSPTLTWWWFCIHSFSTNVYNIKIISIIYFPTQPHALLFVYPLTEATCKYLRWFLPTPPCSSPIVSLSTTPKLLLFSLSLLHSGPFQNFGLWRLACTAISIPSKSNPNIEPITKVYLSYYSFWGFIFYCSKPVISTSLFTPPIWQYAMNADLAYGLATAKVFIFSMPYASALIVACYFTPFLLEHILIILEAFLLIFLV